MKYVIYLRISTVDQDKRTQEKKSIEFVQKHHGGSANLLIFHDTVTSRRAMQKRPGLMQALESLETDDVLIAMRLDRLARNTQEILKIRDIITEKGAEIIMVEQGKMNNRFALQIYAAMAEEESRVLRSRIKEKLDVKKDRGERCGTVPYGYGMHETKKVLITRKGHEPAWKPGILVSVEEEQTILNRMIELFSQGCSFRKIAQCLEDERLHNRKEKPFQHKSIHRILSRLGYSRPKLKPQPKKVYETIQSEQWLSEAQGRTT